MNRYELAESRRQSALDYINANPGALTSKIITALGWKCQASGSDRLSDMVDRGELSRVRATCTAFKTYTYTARVTKTKTAAQTAFDVGHNLNAIKKKRPTGRHAESFRDVNRPPIRNQGGQGALRHEIRRGCSLS